MGFSELKTDMQTRVQKTIESLKKDFQGLRTGRASTGLLDSIMVDAYGSMMPINQVATVSVPEARMLSVSVWDKNLLKHVEKAIRESSLGLNPMNDGVGLRIPLPPLSEERRLELTKIAGKYTEESRVAVRNIRRDILDKIKKMKSDNEISEDEEKRYADEVQKMTDKTIADMDEALKAKEAEIKQV